MPAVWLNGSVVDDGQALISPLDRGFALADGVFETIRIANRRPLWLADHVARLKTGAATLGIPFDYEARDMELAVAQLAEAFEPPDAAVRITLTRGPSSRRGLWPPGEPVCPTLLITISQHKRRSGVRHGRQRLSAHRGSVDYATPG
jgi:branched-chain amino acid aminotransferase